MAQIDLRGLGPSGSICGGCPGWVAWWVSEQTEMWGGRDELVSIRDGLAVPEDVRLALEPMIPQHQFTTYALSWNHAVCLSNHDAHPYELYFPYTTARGDGHILRTLLLAADYEALRRWLPAGTRRLPICRDVWHFSRGTRARKQAARDVVYPPEARGLLPCFPLTVDLLVLQADRLGEQPVAIEHKINIMYSLSRSV